MNISILVQYYQERFKDDKKSILEWIEHDLNHMGLSFEDREETLNDVKQYLQEI